MDIDDVNDYLYKEYHEYINRKKVDINFKFDIEILEFPICKGLSITPMEKLVDKMFLVILY